MSRKTQGGISHSICIAYFLSLGNIVSFPLFDDAPYDLLVDDGNDILRIQCKTATGQYSYKNGKSKYPRIGLNPDKNHKPVYISSFDYIWVMTNENCYLIPSCEISHDDNGTLKSFVISPKYSSFIVSLPFLKGKEPIRPLSQTPLTDKEIARAISLFESGETYRTIGKIMGLPDSKVEYYLLKNNIHRDRFTPDDTRKQIIDLYVGGSTKREISEKLNVTLPVVSYAIKKANLPQKNPVIKPEWKPQIIDMYRSGLTPTDIANMLGIPRPNSVSVFLSRQKWLIDTPS